jgi:K(+)-stimulated pyrophosphate-energized sodium pump
MKVIVIITAVIAFLALIFAYGLSSWIGRSKDGPEKVKELSGFVQEGVGAYFKRQYKALVPVILVLTVFFGFTTNWITAAMYAAGAIFPLLAGLIGSRTAATGSASTARIAIEEGMNASLKMAFRSGAVMGLSTAGFVLLGIGGAYALFDIKSAGLVAGFGFGAATTALFNRVGGGIYCKAADAGASLMERADTGLRKDDPRNPAAIAGCAGGLTGNAAGISSEMFLSFSGALIAAISIAAATREIKPNFGYPFDLPASSGTVFPLAVSAAGLLAAVAGIMFVRGNLRSDPVSAVNAGKYLSNGITAILTLILSYAFFGNFNCAVTVLTGMIAGALNGKITNTYTLGNSKHLKKIAGQSTGGTLMIDEYGIGMMSTLWPAVILATVVLISNGFADLYGITLAAVGVLSTTGMITAIDAFGPVSANAGSIVRMARLSEEAGTVTDALISLGERNAATGKGFAGCAAALTGIALLLNYMTAADLNTIDLLKPSVIAALFFGAMLPVLFSAFSMNSSMKAAAAMIENARNQFHSDAGIMAGTVKPGYGKCVDAGMKATLKGIAAPGLLAVAVPFAAAVFMGMEALGGLLAGALISGVLVSVILSNTGGIWNHSEKFMAGDPYKDAAGFSINCFILMICMSAVVFAPMLVAIRSML